MDALRRARATLGVLPNASPSDVKRHYRELVRRWHPDRFAQDPSGQQEASARMRDINAAYRLLCKSSAAWTTLEETAPGASPGGRKGRSEPGEWTGKRLDRDAIDGIVRSLGPRSPIDSTLGFLTRAWPAYIAFVSWAWPVYIAYVIGSLSGPSYLVGGRSRLALTCQILLVLCAAGLRLRRQKAGGC
jgi:DnaJ domain